MLTFLEMKKAKIKLQCCIGIKHGKLMKCSGTNQVCLEKNKFYPAVDTTAYVKVMHNERLQIITKIWFLPFKVFLTQSTIN